MSSGRSTAAVFLTVIVELLLAVLSLLLHWPSWCYLGLAAFLALACVLALRIARRTTNPVPEEMVPHLPLAPIERREYRIAQVALPSAWSDYDFLFSAIVRWCPTGASADEPIINPAGLAVDAVLTRARALTEHRSPDRVSLVQHELNGALGKMRSDGTGFLQAMAESVTLTLTDLDQGRLDKLATVRKDKALWEHERTYEQDRRAYLGDDVLKDTGSAVVWWLAKNDDHVKKTVEDLGLLAQLSSAARNQPVSEPFRHLVPQPASTQLPLEHGMPTDGSHSGESMYPGSPTAADHIDSFLLAMGLPLDDPQRALLARQMADLVAKNGRPDIAGDLTRRFDAPCPPAPDSPDPASHADDEPPA